MDVRVALVPPEYRPDGAAGPCPARTLDQVEDGVGDGVQAADAAAFEEQDLEEAEEDSEEGKEVADEETAGRY